MRYRNVTWSPAAPLRGESDPSVLAVGDSWFWYPFPGGSLAHRLGDLLRPSGHHVLVAGNNGAETYDYVHGRYRAQVDDMLRRWGAGARALLVSGGGNDFSGFNELRPLLAADCRAASRAEQCFRAGRGPGTVGALMQRMLDNHRLLIARALAVMPADSQVFLHTYDYAIPSGKAVFARAPWLKPALDDARVPQSLQPCCIRHLIDRAYELMHRLEVQGAGRVVLIDSRNTLSPTDWANELHPRPQGFRRIAEQAWRPAFARAGLVETKRIVAGSAAVTSWRTRVIGEQRSVNHWSARE
jgi:hypothetical protein